MLLKKDRFKIYNSLLKLKKRKLIKNIGVSVYTVAELNKILKMFKIDVVQIPINLLDNRFIKNSINRVFKNCNISIHRDRYFDFFYIDDLLQGIELIIIKPDIFIVFFRHVPYRSTRNQLITYK